MRNKPIIPVNGIVVLLLILLNVVIMKEAYTTNANWYWALVITLPLLLLVILRLKQAKSEEIRHEIFQRKKVQIKYHNYEYPKEKRYASEK